MPTSIDPTPIRAAEVLDAVHAPAPEIAARTPGIEAARRFPLDLVRDLTAAGRLRMLVARSRGDGGVDPSGASSVGRRAI